MEKSVCAKKNSVCDILLQKSTHAGIYQLLKEFPGIYN